MSALLGLVASALHLALMLAAAPVLLGGIRRLKARLLGRAGPPVMQPWRDIRRLLRKQPVRAENASPVFVAAPFVAMAATLAAASLVPSFALGMATAPVSDLIVLAGLLALARCAMALAAMDIGTAFGGIGASRSMTFSVVAEPAMLLVVFAFALLLGTSNLDAVMGGLHEGGTGLRVSLGLVLLAALTAAIVENDRLPAGNPATHLELTMVHEAMLLEYSGPPLALIEWTGALRLLVWLSLIADLFAPFGVAVEPLSAMTPVPWLIGLLAWAIKISLLAGGLALFETGIARMRVFRVPEFLGIAVLLGLLAAVLLFVSQGFA